jgi:hypothetical protein
MNEVRNSLTFSSLVHYADDTAYQISDPSNVADVFSTLQLMWSLGSTTRCA